ncbi:MAG TPA: S9 family peptidase [Anaerolineaceae bacterium]|nr:S9 family peptidase [Anaerolineaceae bacterium]
MTCQKQDIPFGLWTSPITPEMISKGKKLEDVQAIPESDGVVWIESLSGKSSLMVKYPGQAPSDLTGSLNPSGGVGYGGGEFCAGKEGAVFAEKNGRLYYKTYSPGEAKPITPGFGSSASPSISPDGRWVLYVHTCEDRDVLALVDIQGEQWPRILASGADFYMQPTWSAKGNRVAWVEWHHPHMPWDQTDLCYAEIDLTTRQLKDLPTRLHAHGAVHFQPCFSPAGDQLAYLVNRGEKDELCLNDLDGSEKVLVEEKIMLPPAWVQGVRAFAWSPDGQIIYYLENKRAQTRLHAYDLSTHSSTAVPNLENFTITSQPSVSADGTFFLLVESNQLPRRAIHLSKGKIEVLARTMADNLESGYLPVSQSISWTSSDGAEVHGLYFAPTHPTATADGAPPVIVYIHGGPTSQVLDGYLPEAGYFTSRGYGYFVINYRGGTGYGRAYRQALNGHWGELDVQDTIEGCKHLIDRGLANPDKLIIKGGSAGGYTVLNSLVHHPGFFKAGLCSYGVSNLFLLDMDTHKFESHYTSSLVGALPKAAQKYHDLSPVFHADQIRDALAVFQGSEDKVVPPNQSESIVAFLRANHVPHVYRLYDGEGHGFRRSENILDFYKTIDVFLKQYVIFSV